MIKKLEQAKRLDEATFIPATRPVFDVSTKGPPKAIISLLKKVAKRKPELEPHIRSTLTGAVNHPSEEIQAAAIDWFAMMTDRMEPEIVQHLSDNLEDLPATVRPKAAEIVRAAGFAFEHDLAQRNAWRL